MKHLCLPLVFALLLLFFIFYANNIKESFLNPFNPGEFPKTQEGPILQDVYRVNPKPHIGKNNYYQNVMMYPRSEMASFKHATNNIHMDEWNTPDNGKCTPAEMCGELYVK